MIDPIEEVIFNECANGDAAWWYLSFADSDLPKGTQFLGAAIVQGFGIGSAALRAHTLGINPGGEVLGFEIPSDRHVPLRFQDRLLQVDDIKEFDREMGGSGDTMTSAELGI